MEYVCLSQYAAMQKSNWVGVNRVSNSILWNNVIQNRECLCYGMFIIYFYVDLTRFLRLYDVVDIYDKGGEYVGGTPLALSHARLCVFSSVFNTMF